MQVEERAQWNVDKDEWVLLPINMKALNMYVIVITHTRA